MEYRTFGKTGLKVSKVGLGAWQFSDAWGVLDYDVAKRTISAALEAGINFIDTAAVYGRGTSETHVGRALRELRAREQVVIATKVPGDLLRAGDVVKAARRSRERLGVDVIDIMQVHWPPCWYNVPTCEYMKALEGLVKEGIIRYIGVSNFPVKLLEEARQCLSATDVVSTQNRYNLIEREAEKELLPYAERNGIQVIAWSPLAKGLLTGKYNPDNLPKFSDVRANDPLYAPDNARQVMRLVQALREIGDRHGRTPGQVALNWLIRAGVIPIPGAKDPEQVISNAASVGWSMSDEEAQRLAEVSNSLNISYVTW